MRRNTLIVRRGTEFNPEGRCGQPKRLADGRRVFHCWFVNETFLSYATDKIMERLIAAKIITRRRSNKTVLYERARYVYYGDGRFWVPVSRKNASKAGEAYELEPYTGTLVSMYPEYQRKYNLPDAIIHCDCGWPIAVVVDNDEFAVTRDSWPVMESFLGLDEHYKPAKWWPENRRAS